jgi:diguanylate cyclase (GGDEF)-like protein
MTRLTKIFIIATAFSLAINVAVVYMNNKSAYQDLQNHLGAYANKQEELFKLCMKGAEQRIMTISSMVSHNPEVVRILKDAREASISGDAQREAKLREELNTLVGPFWNELRSRYGLRQLHFHIPPDTSFLRVHAPHKYGDDLTGVRHTTTDAIKSGKPVQGLEVGRVVGGFRGVYPIKEHDGSNTSYGAVETGDSFDQIINNQQEVTGSEYAVFYYGKLVEEVMWSEYLPRGRVKTCASERCYAEAYTSSGFLEFVAQNLREADDTYTRIYNRNGSHTALTSFPLTDYRGTRDGDMTPVGRVYIGWDASEDVNDYIAIESMNIIYAILGFLVMEFVLIGSAIYISSALRKEVAEKTSEIRQLNEQLSAYANKDDLTGVANRRCFFEVLDKRFNVGEPFGLAWIDVDHFKNLNDTYGHNTGDKVLRPVAQTIRSTLRESDFVGRVGGEEFGLILGENTVEECLRATDRVRDKVSKCCNDTGHSITISIGIVMWNPGDSTKADELTHRSDLALYRAKDNGRNRTEVYDESLENRNV